MDKEIVKKHILNDEEIIVNIVDEVMGKGKAQPMDSLILSENGYKLMKDVHVGDKVYGEDGNLHNIIGVYPQGILDVYKVTFSDGTSTECCNDHLWTYQHPQDKSKGIFRTAKLDEIRRMDLYKETNRGDKNWQIFIPMTKPLQFEKKELPIHPYVLGLLIGDGHIGGDRDSIILTNKEPDVVDKILWALDEDTTLKYKCKTSDNEFIFIDKNCRKNGFNKFKKKISDLGLSGSNSYNKFIPDIYKYSSAEDRLRLLRGLIDTDGSVDGNGYEYTTTSEQLSNDVVFLVQSLGGTAKVIARTTKFTYKGEKKEGHLSYRIHIKMPSNIFICSSLKHVEKLKYQNTEPGRSIRSIEYVGKKECKCILVDNPSHLYLTNDCIVTHNTSAAINFINDSPDDTHFLYITPYLAEVDRIIEKCPGKKFKQPDKKISKLDSIKNLFEKKENIVSTHALFRYFDEEIIDIAYANNYVLIMDEVAEVIEQYNITKFDLDDIMTNYAHVDSDTNLLVWDHKEYKGKFDDVKKLCELKSVAVYNETAMLWLFPITTFRAFRQTYILTYMFNAQTQSYYYNYYHIHYDRLYVKYEDGKYQFTKEQVESYSKYDYRKLINICDNKKLNNIGEKPNALSWNWYNRNKDNSLMEEIKNHTKNYFKNILKVSSDKIIWTTFKDYQNLISGQGYAKGFVSSNMRATNEYMDRDNVAYLVNRYFTPSIKQFFESHGIEVDEDGYATSEMLQFIWRSAIRRGKQINLYVPSKRMRNLLIEWINGQSYKDHYDEENEEESLRFTGDFYFGSHSIVLTDGKISQVKCIKKLTGDNVEIVILQSNSDLLENFCKPKYVSYSSIEYIKLSSSLYQVVSMKQPEEITPDKYNVGYIGTIHKKLVKMKKQTKIKRN